MATKTRYSIRGKVETPISDEQVFSILEKNKPSLGVEKTGFVTFLFYFGVRVSEALRMKPESFTIVKGKMFVDILRLKHSKTTSPLSVKTSRPFVNTIIASVEETKPKHRVWGFSRITAWKIIKKINLHYPHYLRLNRVTNLFHRGYTIDEVRSWTGLTLSALNYYVGVTSTRKIGDEI
jgi:integrase